MNQRIRRILPLLFIFAICGAIGFYCLSHSPAFWFDEGIYYQIVAQWADTGVHGVPIEPKESSGLSFISVGYPVLYPAVLAFRIFGEGILVLRSVALLFLFGFVGAGYVLVKQWHGSKIACWSVLLLVTFAPLYGNGKSFLGEVTGLFYLTLGLLLLTFIEKKDVWKERHLLPAYFGTGLLFGLAMSAKPLYVLIGPALAVAIIIRWRVFFGDRRRIRMSAAGFFGMALPIFLWIETQFGGIQAVSTGIFAHYANPYYVHDFAPLILSNLVRFITESTPAHFLLLFLLAAVSFVSRLLKDKSGVRTAEITGFFFIVLTALFYLRTAGWYRNFFPAHALLFLYAIKGVDILSGKWRYVFFSVPVFAIILTAVQLIPLSQEAISCTVDAPSAVRQKLYEINIVKEPVLFYSVPQIAAGYKGDRWFQYIRMSDQLSLGTHVLDRLYDNSLQTIVTEDRYTDGSEKAIPLCFEPVYDTHHIVILSRNPDIVCTPL